MKRMKIMGLALVAVFAITAFAASSAMALPEIGRCIAKAGGKYTESNCNTKVTKGGSFEFVKTIVNKKFTSAGGEGVLETTSGTKVICKTQSAVGEYKGTTSFKEVQGVVAKFNGCAIPAFGIECNTKGSAAGEIVTNSLTGKMGYISKAGKSVGQELHPLVKKGLFATFECGGGVVNIEVGEGTGKGGDCIIAPVKPSNVSSVNAEEVYSGAGGKQSPQSFEGSTKVCNLESRAGKEAPWERSTQALVTTITNEEALEIRA
jgi:hypothetical protein